MTDQTRRLLDVKQATQQLGVGRSTVFGLMASGELRSVKIGRRRLIPERAISEYIARLEASA